MSRAAPRTARPSPSSPPAHLWAEVVLAERDDFMRRAIGGEFSSTGDGYEYLRLTKPLHIVIAHARALAQEVRP